MIRRTALPTHILRSLALGFLTAFALTLTWPPPACGVEAPTGRRITIGSGSGFIDYPKAQETLGLRPGDTLVIAAGTYKGLALGNLAGTAAAPITVTCDPQTVFTTSEPQPNEFPNVAFVRFEGLRYEKYNSTCMHISGASHDLVFKDFRITGASGYSFHIYDRAKVFSGTKESAFYNFRWEGVTFDGKTNGASISNQDYQPPSNLVSVLLDFEIAGCTFKNFDNTAQAFPVIGFEKCFNLIVRGCTFSDIGMAPSPIGHNVCISVSGTLTAYGNRFTRQWADDVRVWPMKLNALGYGGDAVNRFYNNISWEKRKYAMYEQNAVPQAVLDQSGGRLSRTGSEVFFNTLYRSRTAADSKSPYCAPLVDVYGSDIVIKHNLVIEPEADTPFDPSHNYVYHIGTGGITGIVAENNLVLKTFAEAGLSDTERFAPLKASPARDAAIGRIPYIVKDHYRRERYVGPAADVGAVERQEGEP
ncbi:MAG: hypothetical protein NT049_03950 [Planctomycetota bacterium]|nr:hypothetical protein [Planctomycetota bacterium]